MPDAVYSEINFHITWHTKNNLPLITPTVETKLYVFLKHKIIETPEVYFHAIGGIEDHIHIVVSPPPSLLMSKWIGELKGGSSFEINRLMNRKLLQWQRGYGIISFGTKDLKVGHKLCTESERASQKRHDAQAFGTDYE